MQLQYHGYHKKELWLRNENTDLGVADYDAASKVQRNAAVPVVGAADLDTGMHKSLLSQN